MTSSEITQEKKAVVARSVSEFNKMEETASELLHLDGYLLTVNPLLGYVLKRAARINQLAKQGSVDDAEIIFRSYLEGFMKLMYIISSRSTEDFYEKTKEYFGVLREIGSISESNRLKELSEAKVNANYDPYAKLVLTDEQIENLKQKPSWANRTYRQATKSKWSYSELSKYLSLHFKDEALIPFKLLDHYYAEASHLVHCDEALFRNAWMKPHLGKDYLRLKDVLHISKLLTFVNELLYWICLELMVLTKQRLRLDDLYGQYKIYRREAGANHDRLLWEFMNYGE